jgi:hypothetical protein
MDCCEQRTATGCRQKRDCPRYPATVTKVKASYPREQEGDEPVKKFDLSRIQFFLCVAVAFLGTTIILFFSQKGLP